ncbi:MAG: M20/M25/M40 family metallo-hydrolase [Bacteroidota bacterium]|jgi:hypothetical protein
MKFKLLIVALFWFNQNFSQTVSVENIKKHISVLSNDSLQGRGTGTIGEAKAANYISQEFKKIGLKPVGDNNSYLKSFQYKQSSNPHGASDKDTAVKILNSKNIIGFLDNNSPNTLIIGAHYDHLGFGDDQNSLEANPKGKIHNGADDNASGVAGVIELARYFSNSKSKSNYLFLCFSGEELGLIGSKKFVDNSDFEPAKINAMINMDMIGRLNDSTKKLMVYGVGTSPSFVNNVENANTYFKLVLDSSGVGPSDHTSFYLKNIPVLHFFTGQHPDYHKPSDDLEKINFVGEQKVLEYIIDIVKKIDTEPKLEFKKTRDSNNDNAPKFKVTLGIMPDYSFEGKGVKVDGVSDNKPAFNAGVKKGDIIIKLGNLEVTDMRSYMQGLADSKKGDTKELVVKRNGKDELLKVTF